MTALRNVTKAKVIVIALSALIVIMLFFAAAIDRGYHLGQRQAEMDIARLSTIWPDVKALPEPDKVAIMHAAFACRLAQIKLPALRVEIENCLMAGAVKHDMDSERKIGGVIDRLLREARAAKGEADRDVGPTRT
jgi:hypothetical protein